ncbi:hypothetical protein IW261DRAFT_1510984, partial [Armillaria novae-zelandiae]
MAAGRLSFSAFVLVSVVSAFSIDAESSCIFSSFPNTGITPERISTAQPSGGTNNSEHDLAPKTQTFLLSHLTSLRRQPASDSDDPPHTILGTSDRV